MNHNKDFEKGYFISVSLVKWHNEQKQQEDHFQDQPQLQPMINISKSSRAWDTMMRSGSIDSLLFSHFLL